MLINISKYVIKGIFPYFFSHYITDEVNTKYSKVHKFNNICSKTKKKLMYSINPNNILESLWFVDYKKQNLSRYQYKFKVSINNCLTKSVYKCSNKPQFIVPNRTKNLYSSDFYNSNLRRSKILH